MKKFAKTFGSITLVAMIGVLFPTCPAPTGGGRVGGKEHAVGWMDIHEQSDKFNAMVVGEDGSSMYFSVDQAKMPVELYYKPEIERDDGYTLLFNEEDGMLDTMISNGHVFKFYNYDGYTYDWAVIYPDETIEYHYEQQSEVNWDQKRAINSAGRLARLAGSGVSARTAGSGQARSIFDDKLTYSDFETAVDIVGDAVGIATCVSALVLQVTWVGCALWAIPKVGSLIMELAPERPGADNKTAGRLYDMYFDTMTCVGQKDILDCISVLSKLIGIVVDLDIWKKDKNLEGLEKIIENGKAKALKGTLDITPRGPVPTGTTLVAKYKGEEMSFQWVKDGIHMGPEQQGFPDDKNTYSTSFKTVEAGNYLVIAFKDGWFSDRMGNSATVTVLARDMPGNVTISPPGPVPMDTKVTARYSGLENVYYEWRKSGSNDLLQRDTNIDSYTPTEMGNYTVTVKVLGGGYKSKTASVTVTYRQLKGEVTIYPRFGPYYVGSTLTAEYSGLEYVNLSYVWKGYGLSRGRNGVTVSQTDTFTPEEPGSYEVTVSAFNEGYTTKTSERVSVKAATVVTVPGAPTNLMQTGSTGTTVTLEWDPVPGAVGYTLYQVPPNGNDRLIHTGILTPGVNITGLRLDTEYTVRVSAYNNAGEGPKSSPKTVKTAWY